MKKEIGELFFLAAENRSIRTASDTVLCIEKPVHLGDIFNKIERNKTIGITRHGTLNVSDLVEEVLSKRVLESTNRVPYKHLICIGSELAWKLKTYVKIY